ncbi:autotransporter outer membrane beta-barrel domain-containing protein [Aquipseudomonas ullengensis]|uniref:Autotransporter outer membrane beta-barrel domain-containing protein n=1 Tax=Aquipseudomonas ullengensis TaxID=2759166 RepID=A0A7W4QAI3_9GAMM|nr:autotransporter outer membrane beta-barrel domain-containing protein [Pseudomonas ullengensis]MBB2495674.1 autotransporter outer membrane beta-barrel domain-containing protein [Pseudomonas ullengensis]
MKGTNAALLALFGGLTSGFCVADASLPLDQRSLLLEDTRLPREAALDRLQQIRFAFRERAAQPGQWQSWARAYGGYGSWDAGSGSPRLERRSGGLLVGLDRPLQGMWVAGVLAGAGRSELQAEQGGDSDVDSYHLGGYAATRFYQLGFKLGATYSWHELHSERHRAGQSLHADSRAGSAQLFGEASYSLDFRDFSLEPFAGLAYVQLDADHLREHGGDQALRLQSEAQDGSYLTLGWRAATSWQVAQRKLVGRASLAGRHGFVDAQMRGTAVRLSSGISEALEGREFERDNLRLDLGLDYELSQDLYLGLTYAGQYAEDARDNSLAGRLSLRF